MAKSKTARSLQHVPPEPPERLSVPVADSHTHLDMVETVTAEESIAQAASVGVDTLIQVGCDLPGSRWAVDLASRHPDVHATVALHPNEAPRLVHGDFDSWAGGQQRAPGGQPALDKALAEIDELAGHDEVVAVGETGLDYFRTGEHGTHTQQESFRRHVEIAKRHDKALVIHDREAHQDVLRILREEGAPQRVIFHCYSGDVEMAKTCAEHGYFLSFAGNITFSSAQPLRDALAAAPADLLLVETDAPFLTPAPFRGRPNAPYLIPVTLRAMAETRGEDADTLAARIAANTRRVFQLPEPGGQPGGEHPNEEWAETGARR